MKQYVHCAYVHIGMYEMALLLYYIYICFYMFVRIYLLMEVSCKYLRPSTLTFRTGYTYLIFDHFNNTNTSVFMLMVCILNP